MLGVPTKTWLAIAFVVVVGLWLYTNNATFRKAVGAAA